MKAMKSSIVVSFVLVLIGCAATPETNTVQTDSASLSRYKNAYIVIEAEEEVKNRHGYYETAHALRNELHRKLRDERKFQKIGLQEIDEDSVEINVTIDDLHYVSGAGRGLFGIAAGRAVLKVTMKVMDNETKEVLLEVQTGDESSHAQGVFSPVTSKQVRAIANELVAAIN